LDRAQGAAEFAGDFFVGVAFQLPLGDGPQFGVGERGQQAPVLLGQLGGELRRRLAVEQLLQAHLPGAGSGDAGQRRLIEDRVATPLRAALAEPELVGLAGRDGDQQPPEVVAVVQLREAILGGAAAEAVEGAQRHVLLVRTAARRAFQFLAGQPDQPLEIALPQLLRGRRVPVAQLAEPLAHRLIRRHRPGPPTGKTGKRDRQRLYCLALRLRKAQAQQVTTISAVLLRVGVPGQVPARRGGLLVALHMAWVETQAGARGLLEFFPNGLPGSPCLVTWGAPRWVAPLRGRPALGGPFLKGEDYHAFPFLARLRDPQPALPSRTTPPDPL